MDPFLGDTGGVLPRYPRCVSPNIHHAPSETLVRRASSLSGELISRIYPAQMLEETIVAAQL